MTSDLQTSDEVLKELLQIWSKTENAYFYAHLCIDYGKLLYERNRLKEAEQYVLQTLEVGRKYGNTSLEVMAVLLLARIYLADDRSEMADLLLRSLAEQVDATNYPKFAWKIELFRAQQEWRQGKGAQEWLEVSGLQVEDEIPPSMIEDYDFYARLLAEQQNLKEAISLTERLLWIAQREGRQSDIIRLLTHKSLLLAKRGDVIQSMYVLEEALSLAEPDGYIRTFLDEGEPLLKLLGQYVEAHQNRYIRQTRKVSIAYVKQLQILFPVELNTTIRSESEKGPARSVTAKEMEVLRLIHQGMSNKEIAAELSISLSTTKTHINNLYRKLQVNSRMLAIQRAIQLKLIK